MPPKQHRHVSKARELLIRLQRYEVPRKALHSSIGFFTIYGWATHASVPAIVKGLSTALVIITSADILRFNSPTFERIYEHVLGFLMRDSERQGAWNGVIYYLLGVIFCLSVLPRDLATLSIVMLSWADTIASVAGRKLGKYTFRLPPPFAPRKTLAGTLGAMAVGASTAYVFYTKIASAGDQGDLSWVRDTSKFTQFLKAHNPTYPPAIALLPSPKSTLSIQALCLLSAVSAGLAEGLDVWGLDDNLTLPVLFAIFQYAGMWILG